MTSSKKIYSKEVHKGWMILIPKRAIPNIKGCGVIPIGITKQITINDKGERIEKRRLTHDCSNVRDSGYSVNNMVDEELLEECTYGFCPLRILHNIQAIRLQNPTEKYISTRQILTQHFEDSTSFWSVQ